MEYDDDHEPHGRAIDDSLKPYMAHSRIGGAGEGAVLVFAHNTREAKRVGWCSILIDLCDGEYIDMAVKLMREPQLYENADQDKLARGIAHVIDSPKSCMDCELWGEHLNEAGVCESCAEGEED